MEALLAEIQAMKQEQRRLGDELAAQRSPPQPVADVVNVDQPKTSVDVVQEAEVPAAPDTPKEQDITSIEAVNATDAGNSTVETVADGVTIH